MAVQIHEFVAVLVFVLTVFAVLVAVLAFASVTVSRASLATRKRVALVVVLAVLVGIAALSASDGGTAINACYGIEEGSAMWWLMGCWWLS